MMRLSNLLNGFTFPLPPTVDRDIARLILDSRQIKANDVFVALKGSQLDGRQFIQQAIQAGAGAVLVDSDVDDHIIWQHGVPCIPVYQLAPKLGTVAARFYDFPANKMTMIGVTGTNGKTSCVHYIAQALEAYHIHCGIIGTLGHGFYGAVDDVGLTTPDAISLQAILQELVKKDARAVAMEVSSHSIDQGRINGINFGIGIFTNLSQDHLDYHGDMQTYAAVKRRFLAEFPVNEVIINADDLYGKEWIASLSARKKIYSYSIKPPQTFSHSVPTVFAKQIQQTTHGLSAVIETPWGVGETSLSLIGEFNLSNALATLTTLCVYGMHFKQALAQLAMLKPVAGRMQTLGGSGKPMVVVDYSHTPDALEKALLALRTYSQGKLVCVFGCGGNRDHSKRPLMAEIAERYADKVIITNDNPRQENPDDIAKQILKGFSHPERVEVILDRAQAIKKSIEEANASDCILIAGKGAEHYQQIGNEKRPFDDVKHAQKALGQYDI